MKKTIIALAAAIAAAFSASAYEQYFVQVNKTDGTEVRYWFLDVPVAQIEGDDLKFTMAMTHETVLYPFAEVNNLTFGKVDLAVEGIGTDHTGVSFAITAETLEMTGAAAGCEVAVYDAAGALRARGTADAAGALSLPVGQLDKGVYLVKAGNNSFKFIR